jgi:dUTP pyrophosphatase
MKVVVDPGASIPTRAHENDAGLDLCCAKGGVIWPHGSRTFDTGVHIELPPGTFGKVESKSGLNVNHGVVSCGGVIDEGYTGSICVKLYNLSWKPYRVHDGDKIAQLIIMHCRKPVIEIVGELEETDRNCNGFGSTGR